MKATKFMLQAKSLVEEERFQVLSVDKKPSAHELKPYRFDVFKPQRFHPPLSQAESFVCYRFLSAVTVNINFHVLVGPELEASQHSSAQYQAKSTQIVASWDTYGSLASRYIFKLLGTCNLFLILLMNLGQ